MLVSQVLSPIGLTQPVLAQALRSVSGVAEDIGPLLAAMFDGSTPFPVQVPRPRTKTPPELDRTSAAGAGPAALGNTGYTSFVKVAVSLPDELYEEADRAAARLGLNRSQFAQAIEQRLRELSQTVTERLNAVVETATPELGAAAARRLIDTGVWEW